MIAGLAASSAESTRADGVVRLDIVDVSVGRDHYTSIDAVGNSGYRSFISGVYRALAPSAAVANRRFGTAAGHGGGSALVFRRSPLVTSGDAPYPTLPSPPPARAGACRVGTPWFTFTVARGPGRRIDGVFHWSERQVLRDKAVLAGVALARAPVPAPLPRSEFERMAQAYTGGELSKVPPELLWLFRQAPQNTRGRFSNVAVAHMGRLAADAAEYYARLAGALAARCAAGGRTDISVGDIREAQSILQ